MKRIKPAKIAVISILAFSIIIFLYVGLLVGGVFIVRHGQNKLPGSIMLSAIPLPKSMIQAKLNDTLWFVRCYTIMALHSSVLRSKNVILPILKEKLGSEREEMCKFALAEAIGSYGDTMGLRRTYADLVNNGFWTNEKALKRLRKLNQK